MGEMSTNLSTIQEDLSEASPWRKVFTFSRPGIVGYLTTYLVLLMFIPSSLIFQPLGGIGTPALAFSLILLIWYITSVMVGRIDPSGAGKPIWVAMFLFSLAVLASFVAGMTRDITQVEVLGADRGLIQVVAWAGLIIVVSQCVTSYDGLETVLRRAVLFGSIVAAIGIFEFYSGVNVSGYIHIPGLSNNIAYNTLLDRSGFNRPSSTSIDPIEFGVVMAMFLPLALHQAMNSPQRPAAKWRRWLPVALIAFAIPVSLSRSGIVGAVAALLFLIPTWKPYERRAFYVSFIGALLVIKVAAAGLLGTMMGYFTGMFGGGGQSNVSTRTGDYSRNWPYIVQRPLFGRGFDTFYPPAV